MEEFCKKYLDTDVKAFQYRLRQRRCYPNEIIYISWVLGESVHDLFGEDFTELMRTHGPDHITKKLKDLFNKASKKQKQTYLEFVGAIIQTEVVKQTNGVEKNSLVIDEIGLVPSVPEPAPNKKLSDYLEDIVIMR